VSCGSRARNCRLSSGRLPWLVQGRAQPVPSAGLSLRSQDAVVAALGPEVHTYAARVAHGPEHFPIDCVRARDAAPAERNSSPSRKCAQRSRRWPGPQSGHRPRRNRTGAMALMAQIQFMDYPRRRAAAPRPAGDPAGAKCAAMGTSPARQDPPGRSPAGSIPFRSKQVLRQLGQGSSSRSMTCSAGGPVTTLPSGRRATAPGTDSAADPSVRLDEACQASVGFAAQRHIESVFQRFERRAVACGPRRPGERRTARASGKFVCVQHPARVEAMPITCGSNSRACAAIQSWSWRKLHAAASMMRTSEPPARRDAATYCRRGAASADAPVKAD